MPSWKKVIVSGSDASLNSLVVNSGVTGSLQGTASWAVSSSQAITASFVRLALSASYASSSTTSSYSLVATSASYALNATSTSFATFAANAGLLNNTGSGTFATTGSNVFKASQTIDGNLFLSGSNRLLYNNNVSSSLLFGFFDGGSIYGPYYQMFGNQYSDLTQRGSAEFVFDTRNGGGSGFNVVSYNGSGWTTKFRVNDSGAQVTGSLTVITGSGIEFQVTNTGVKIGNVITDSHTVTGSINISGSSTATSFTGSLLGTASRADNATSASYALNATSASFASTSISSSFATNAVSASFATQANTSFTASSADNFLVRGTLTAQTIVAQVITSSTDFVTGSTRFGSSQSNTHQFTGSVSITGSLNVVGTGITGSLLGTASRADNATSASYALNATSASYALNATSASYALTSTSASFAPTATNVYIQGGNSFGTQALLGTNDAQNLAFETNGTVRMTINGNNGSIGIGTTIPTGRITIQRSGTGVDTDIDFLNEAGQGPKAKIRFGGTNEELSFWTGGTASERVRITSVGNVGIGLTSPVAKLQISGSNTDAILLVNSPASASILVVSGSGNVGIGTTSPVNILHAHGSSDGLGYIRITDSVTGATATDGLRIGYNSGVLRFQNYENSDVQFLTNNTTEAIRIKNDGNVGIGTTNPSTKLHVYGTTGLTIETNSGNVKTSLEFNSAFYGGTIGGIYTYPGGGAIGNNIFGESANSSIETILFSNSSSKLKIGTVGTDAFSFYTNSTEKMRIASNGSVGIGTTSPVAPLHVNGVVAIGTTTVSTEGNLYLGARGTDEGGQIILQSGTSFTSASMIDTYGSLGNEFIRILRGSNTTSNAVVAQFNLHTRQFSLPAYTSTSSFAGTATAYLAVDATGSVITVAGSGGASLSGGATNYVARWASSTTLTTGSIFDNGTNVGIGTTSPIYPFNIVIPATGSRQDLTNINRAAPNFITFTNPQYSTLASIGLLFRVFPQSDSRQGAGIVVSGGTNNGATDLSIFTSTSPDGLASTSSADLTIIGNTKYVGIGTTSPAQKLHIMSGSVLAEGGGTNNGIIIGAAGNNVGGAIKAKGVSNEMMYFDSTNTVLNGESNIYFRIANSDKATINSNGNVGIGTTNPITLLNIASSAPVLTFTRTDNATNPFAAINFSSTSTVRWQIATNNAIGTGFEINQANGSTNRFYIDTNGNVGIGTSAPSQKLHVAGGYFLVNNNGSGDANSGIRIFSTIAATHYNWMMGAQYNVSDTFEITPSTVVGGTTFSSPKLVINANGNVGIGVTTPAYPLEVNGKIYASTEVQGGTAFINDTGGISVFGSNTSTRSIRLGRNGTSNDIFITGSSGNVGIGTATPGFALDVNGTGRFTTIIETSSVRYKKSIKTLPSQLATINALRPVTFKWKDKKKGEDLQYGLIAEELQQIMPEAVSLNSDGNAEAISYTKLVPILIKAVQELQAKVEKLEKQKK